MTSEQIQNLCAMVAKNGTELPNGCAEAISLMHVQFLGEIAYQLARQNEREESDAARYKSWYCPKCDEITTTHVAVSGAKCWQCKTAMAVTL